MRLSTIAAALACALLAGCGAGGPLSEKADRTTDTTQTSDDGGREETQTDIQDSPLSPDEQSLVDRLPVDVTGCEPNRDSIDENRAIASVFCEVSGFTAVYTAFPNAGDMRFYYEGTDDNLANGSCEDDWERENVWELDGEVKGRYKCYDDDEEDSVIEWTHSTKYIHGFIYSEPSERDALYEAWTFAGP
jgi:predicted small lipoprotein YifL